VHLPAPVIFVVAIGTINDVPSQIILNQLNLLVDAIGTMDILVDAFATVLGDQLERIARGRRGREAGGRFLEKKRQIQNPLKGILKRNWPTVLIL
jgi:hypothetical protein